MAQAYYFYDVIVSGMRGNGVLSYASSHALDAGQLVRIPLKQTIETGMVWQAIPTPSFSTKPISDVIELPPMPGYIRDTLQWLADYYGCDLGSALQLLLPPRVDLIPASSPAPGAASNQTPHTPAIQLTRQQTEVLSSLLDTKQGQWLLHGVTGSGKTAIYIELARRLRAEGQSTLVLVPEITLASQVIGEFQQYLGGNVFITHSRLPVAERRRIWQHALTSREPVIIIGPRSALFTPIPDLGAIIMDECHEHTYKQEQTPRYHTRDVAQFIARQAGIRLVLASATPGVHDLYQQQNGQLELLSLPQPIHANPRSVDIIDMRGHKDIISPQLHRELEATLEAGEQSILFINRRGSASQVLCRDCGWVARCAACDIPQTWHGDSGHLRCHWCGSQDKLPGACPDCHSLQWRFLGIGTKRIESQVREAFPHATIMRLDRDSALTENLTTTMERLRSGDVDIIIGTQMVAKGLDLPGVTLIGVVLADTMLHIPDMGSNERTYQLLHQVIGRAGRRDEQPSRVLIQTYNPSHHAITYASEHDFSGFMATELDDRRQLGYPPFNHLLKLTCKRKTSTGARRAADRLAQQIGAQDTTVTIRGPAPAWREYAHRHFYWHLIVTADTREPLLAITRNLPQGWQADLDPIDLL